LHSICLSDWSSDVCSSDLSSGMLLHRKKDRREASCISVIRSNTAYRITDIQLASRLSFFLWSSIPDDELLNLAIGGKLSDRAVLEQQVRRMLKDERAETLVTNFAEQWLYLRNLATVSPDA